MPVPTRHRTPDRQPAVHHGTLARLGRWSATHLALVLLGWAVVIGVLGGFAPHVESALSGAGWQDSESQSVQARTVIDQDFSGLGATALQVVVHDTRRPIAADPGARRALQQAEALLASSPTVSRVVPPRPGSTLSGDGRTAVIEGGARGDANSMVAAAEHLTPAMTALGTTSVSVSMSGDSALWADFNSVNRSAMIRSEVLSWPVTLIVLVLAFGSLVAAGLPLMLTLVGLLSAAGALVLATHLAPVSIWALNFALMFALALGIDYALFLTVRFRSALAARAAEPDKRRAAVDAVTETMGTAGKAIAFSGATVLVALSTVLIVPSPAFRSMALGIMLSVVAVLAATLTLLPAVLARLGGRVNSGQVRIPRRRRRSSTTDHFRGVERLLDRLGAALSSRPRLAALGMLIVLAVLALPLAGMRTGMPSIAIIPASQTARVGYNEVQAAFGTGAPGALQVLTPVADTAHAATTMRADPGIAVFAAAGESKGWDMTEVIPTTGPSTPATGATIERIRAQLGPDSLVGGAAAENHDLQAALAARTPLVFGLLLGLGFLMLLVALGSPLLAFVGIASNLGSIAAAFGVATLIFQDGHLAGLLHFQPQGFIDAWAPLFFGAMLTGVAMDYTLFLLTAAREHYDANGDPQAAMRAALRTSGRVIVAAAAVMVAVFLTFALSGPLAPKEMGVILAIAVLLDALCIRLIMLPAILHMAGHHAWKTPRWLAPVLPRVTFTH